MEFIYGALFGIVLIANIYYSFYGDKKGRLFNQIVSVLMILSVFIKLITI